MCCAPASRGPGTNTPSSPWPAQPRLGESSEAAWRVPEQAAGTQGLGSKGQEPTGHLFSRTGVRPLRGEASGETGPAQHSRNQPSPAPDYPPATLPRALSSQGKLTPTVVRAGGSAGALQGSLSLSCGPGLSPGCLPCSVWADAWAWRRLLQASGAAQANPGPPDTPQGARRVPVPKSPLGHRPSAGPRRPFRPLLGRCPKRRERSRGARGAGRVPRPRSPVLSPCRFPKLAVCTAPSGDPSGEQKTLSPPAPEFSRPSPSLPAPGAPARAAGARAAEQRAAQDAPNRRATAARAPRRRASLRPPLRGRGLGARGGGGGGLGHGPGWGPGFAYLRGRRAAPGRPRGLCAAARQARSGGERATTNGDISRRSTWRAERAGVPRRRGRQPSPHRRDVGEGASGSHPAARERFPRGAAILPSFPPPGRRAGFRLRGAGCGVQGACGRPA